jgi:hypothetical protein
LFPPSSIFFPAPGAAWAGWRVLTNESTSPSFSSTPARSCSHPVSSAVSSLMASLPTSPQSTTRRPCTMQMHHGKQAREGPSSEGASIPRKRCAREGCGGGRGRGETRQQAGGGGRRDDAIEHADAHHSAWPAGRLRLPARRMGVPVQRVGALLVPPGSMAVRAVPGGMQPVRSDTRHWSRDRDVHSST